MFCPKCGKELPPNAKFCGGCGSPVPQQSSPQSAAPPTEPLLPPPAPQPEPAPQPQPTYQSQSAYPPQSAYQSQPASPPKAKKSRKMALLSIPAAVIVAVVLVAFNFTALAARVAPGFALNRGVDKLSSALETQTNSGPASILPTLLQYLKEGSFTFSGNLEDPNYGDAASFSGTLLTAKEGRELMLQDMTVTYPYARISPFSFYLSSDALAIRSYDLTGDSAWYGFYLNRPLAEQNSSLSQEQTETLQHQIDALSGFLNNQEDPRAAAIVKELKATVASFLENTKPSVSSQTVHTSSGSAKATVLTYRFDMEDLSVLAGDLFDVLLEEDNAAYLANSYLSMYHSYYIDDSDVAYLISSLTEARREVVSSLRSDMDGSLVLQFALASDGTLIQVTCTGSFENQYLDETVGFECTLSFGVNPSKNDDIDFHLKVTDPLYHTAEFSLTSVTTSLSQNGGTNQTITLEYKDPYYSGKNSIVLSTDWTPSTNEFSTSFTITNEGDIYCRFRANGTLAIEFGSMELDVEEFSLSAYDWWYSELHEVMRGSFQLEAKAGSSISMPDFDSLFDCEAVYYMF